MHFPSVSREGRAIMERWGWGVIGVGVGGERRTEQELAEAERSGEAGDRRAGRPLKL